MTWIVNTGGAPVSGAFPLSINTSGRYLQSPDGTPFLMVGDTPWMMPNQLTNAQIDTYLVSAASFGITAILIEAPGFLFTSQSTGATATGVNKANNADGVAPFTVMDPFSWVLNDTYWQRVDYIVNQAKARGIFVWLNPVYLGINGTAGSGSGIEGCMGEVTAASAGTLQTYGAALANRYTQGNVGWSMGGDYKGTLTERDKQWNVITGIRTVRTTDLVCGHPARGEDSYTLWGPGGQNYTGWNVGTDYVAADGTDGYSLAATSYGRSGPIPFGQIEAGYYGERTDLEARRANWETALSGAAFVMGGTKLWSFGDPIAGGNVGAASALSTWLGSMGYQQMGYLVALLKSYAWHKLVPKTDASLVSSALGTGTGRVCPALSSDGTFAMIYSPAVNVTVVLTNFAQGTVRVRSFDPTTGGFTAVGSFANTGSQSFTVSAESVLVLD